MYCDWLPSVPAWTCLEAQALSLYAQEGPGEVSNPPGNVVQVTKSDLPSSAQLLHIGGSFDCLYVHAQQTPPH